MEAVCDEVNRKVQLKIERKNAKKALNLIHEHKHLSHMQVPKQWL